MGYTHYWNFTTFPNEIENGAEKFKNAISLFKERVKKVNVELGNGMSEVGSKPIITDTMIVFNGIGENSHETFYISMDYDEEEARFSFCKTARKPYDKAVCIALLCFKEAFGDDFEIYSDGSFDEQSWPLAFDICNVPEETRDAILDGE